MRGEGEEMGNGYSMDMVSFLHNEEVLEIGRTENGDNYSKNG